jgi:hypothetical protein
MIRVIIGKYPGVRVCLRDCNHECLVVVVVVVVVVYRNP